MAEKEGVVILLLEDNDFDAELTIRALKQFRLSHQIVRFDDGQEALDYLLPEDQGSALKHRAYPKLILLDLKMPGISGLEVLQAVKNDSRTRQIPVVVLTSSTEVIDILKSYEMGANSYIAKPVEYVNFMECVKKVGGYWLQLNIAS